MNLDKVHEHKPAEEGNLLMPFYIVCDVSYSMEKDMTALNAALQGIRNAIVSRPEVDDVAHISLITFSDSARVVLPLSQMSDSQLPPLTPEGGTNFGAAFRLLATTIDQDVENLKQRKYKLFRACAFFLTDGEPQDSDWLDTFRRELTYDPKAERGNRRHPIFVPFGFRQADKDKLSAMAFPPGKGKYYMANNVDPATALAELMEVIMKTIVSTGLTAGTKPELLVAESDSPDVKQGESAYDADWVD